MYMVAFNFVTYSFRPPLLWHWAFCDSVSAQDQRWLMPMLARSPGRIFSRLTHSHPGVVGSF